LTDVLPSKTGFRRENGGKRSRGRSRNGMIDDLKEGSYVKIKRRAEGRVASGSWMPGPARGQRINDEDETLTDSAISRS